MVAPEEIIVPAGDGVRGVRGAPRLNDDERFDTFEGGVGARIGNEVVPPILATTGPLGAKVFEVGDRVTVIEVCVSVLVGKAVSCVRPDASTI